nr:cytochrome c oxidase assembly factor 7 homolog [Onthophagus taurus]
MALDFKSETDVKEFLNNLGIEYRFGCYSEKNPEVCHLLGDYLEAVKKDYEKAVKVYKSNCDDYKYGKSCLKFGSYALLGKGGQKEDFKKGYEYLKKACDDGIPEGCLHEGLLLLSHSEKCGIVDDPSKGMRLLEKACDADNAHACYYASGFHISGLKDGKNNEKKSQKNDSDKYIIPKDMNQAYKYALHGCNLGNVYCCINLSQMYSKGDGVGKNAELAEKYKKIALDMQSEILETNKTLNFQQGL